MGSWWGGTGSGSGIVKFIGKVVRQSKQIEADTQHGGASDRKKQKQKQKIDRPTGSSTSNRRGKWGEDGGQQNGRVVMGANMMDAEQADGATT